jgi:hypothetical protein
MPCPRSQPPFAIQFLPVEHLVAFTSCRRATRATDGAGRKVASTILRRSDYSHFSQTVKTGRLRKVGENEARSKRLKFENSRYLAAGKRD